MYTRLNLNPSLLLTFPHFYYRRYIISYLYNSYNAQQGYKSNLTKLKHEIGSRIRYAKRKRNEGEKK